ncbi:family 1 glycosylhydrolase [Ruegeria atlantica]|uniref:family 1 glycosylhydrolase n=1 Tax=Ruegeria atlantica TaxID=81569 RepID=UPI00147F5E1E|nr:family 1 glycosylhydrolase [Ruegeria atlantica]
MNYTRSDFPKDFLFGVAASAHRIEQEFDLVHEAGFDCYQFSINWARVLPEGRGAMNETGLDFYDRLTDALLARGLRPCATLNQCELPAALADLGGWRNRAIADWFADFTEIIMGRVGDRMYSVAPISIPAGIGRLHSFANQTLDTGNTRATARTMHHMLLAHGCAIEAMRGLGMTNLGVVLDQARAEPSKDPATDLLGDILNRFCPAGVFNKTYPAMALESLERHLPASWQGDMETIGTGVDWCGLTFDTHWPSAVDLSRFQHDYTQDRPIFVTGMAGRETSHGDGWGNDLNQHLSAVQNALKQGVPVKGVFIRSMLDRGNWAPNHAEPKDVVDTVSNAPESKPKVSYSILKPVLSGGAVSLPLAQPAGAMRAHWNLVADIGGTNTRLGVIADGKLTDLRKYPTGTLPELLNAFHTLRDEIGTDPRAVVAAGAGPVKNGTIRLTNAKLDLSECDIGKATGAQHTFVINDFTAAAWSVAEITGDDVEVLQGAATPPPGTRLVVGPGTGLGVGALLYSESRYHTASGEGGHIGLSPRHVDEVEIFKAARHIAPDCFFDETLVLEAEMFLSGTGLPILYRAAGMAAGQADTPMRSAKDILDDARTQTDLIAEKTAHMFTTHLGAVMGDLAVVLMPVGGVFLVGGVAEKNRWLFKEAFRDAFNAGGRFTDLRRSMSLYVSEQDEFGIVGANNFCKSALAR